MESFTDLECKEVRTAASLQRKALKRWRVPPSVAGGVGEPLVKLESDTTEDSGYQR